MPLGLEILLTYQLMAYPVLFGFHPLWTDIGLMRSILTFLIGFHCPRSVVDLGWQTGDLIDRFPSTVEAARSFLGGADPLLKSLGPILSPAALAAPPPSPTFRPPARGWR